MSIRVVPWILSAPGVSQGRFLFGNGGEKRAMKRKACQITALMLVLVCALMLTGCKSEPLPEGMDENTLLQEAEQVREDLTAGEYQQVVDTFRTDMKEQFGVTVQMVEDVMATVSEAGAYVRTTDTATAGGKDENFDEPYGLAVLYCKHEKKDVIYEFSFDTSYQLIGLSVRLR